MGDKIDFKKRDKVYYLPPAKPEVIDIPEMNFLMVDGAGDPNDAAFQNAIEALYTLSYTIKMSPKAGQSFVGYYDYGVAPLEGLWDGGSAREDWTWTAMIRQPEFVGDDVFAWAVRLQRSRSRLTLWTSFVRKTAWNCLEKCTTTSSTSQIFGKYHQKNSRQFCGSSYDKS